jgi:hypothetical protein
MSIVAAMSEPCSSLRGAVSSCGNFEVKACREKPGMGDVCAVNGTGR